MKMMMKKIMTPFLACIIAAAITVSSAAVFAGNEIVCPTRLAVQHDIAQDVPDGWYKHDDRSDHPFMNVMFTEGSPDLLIILAPAAKREVKGELIDEWEFTGATDEYWVSCLYNGTSATVARKLPKDVAYCEVRYDKVSSSPNAKAWRCLSVEQLKQERGSN